MPRLNLQPLGALLACVCLVGVMLPWEVRAQPATAPHSQPPATLRLAQVVPRLPKVHLFALAQNEAGDAVTMRDTEMRALVGSDYLPVGVARDEGIAFVFLIDVSGSMKDQLDGIKDAIRMWIDSMTPNVDQGAVVSFGSMVKTIASFTSGHEELKKKVSDLVARDPETLLYQGLIQAIDISRRLDKPLPLRRAIVVLTDGLDDQKGGAGRQEVLDALAVDPVPIYGIGVSNGKRDVDAALKDFAALLRASGGDFQRFEVLPRSRREQTNATTMEQYQKLRNVVARTQHLTTDCPACTLDGSPLVVRLYLTQGPATVSSGSVTVRAVGPEGIAQQDVIRPPPPPPPPPPPLPWWERLFKWITTLGWQWLVLAALALAVVIAGLVAFFLPKSSPTPDTTRIYPKPGPTQPSPPDPNGVFIVQDAITPGTQLEAQRLRITPLGHNDVPAQERVFTGELTVGRSQDNQINIYNDTQVSTKHCTLAPKDGLILVCDEGSRNGTRVNGVPIEQFMHAEPDSILGVGRTELRMQLLAPGRQ